MDRKLIAEHRRLAVLRHLEASGDYTSNASILGDVLRGVGLAADDDQLRTVLVWLQDQDLVALMGDHQVTLATATERGAQVARGEIEHPGVRRPKARA